MHYGGGVLDAHDSKTKKMIGTNKELSPLDIEKLNYYYPTISKLASAGITLETWANSNEIHLSSLYQNRSHRNEDLSKCGSGVYTTVATGDNLADNDTNNNTVDDQSNYQIMVEFNKEGFPFYVLVSFVIGQDTVLKPI